MSSSQSDVSTVLAPSYSYFQRKGAKLSLFPTLVGRRCLQHSAGVTDGRGGGVVWCLARDPVVVGSGTASALSFFPVFALFRRKHEFLPKYVYPKSTSSITSASINAADAAPTSSLLSLLKDDTNWAAKPPCAGAEAMTATF